MPPLSQILRDTNCRLGFLLDSIAAKRGQPATTTPEHMGALLSELLRAGVGLRAAPLPTKGNDPELDGQLEIYRRNVETLRELLPSMHTQLLVERARLEAQRTRVQSAAAWARASRQTL
jgi:hypothetical protein